MDEAFTRALKQLADGPAPTSHQVEGLLETIEAHRRRRKIVMTSVVLSTICAAAAGSLLVNRFAGNDDEPARPAPAGSKAPAAVTLAELCRSQAVATYAVETYDSDLAPAASPEKAAERWIREGESLLNVVSVGGGARQWAVLGQDRPREILVVVRESGMWMIEATVACLDKAPDGCRSQVVYQDRTYLSISTRPGAGPGVGGPLGMAVVDACVSSAGSWRSRGSVAPVSVFRANEEDPRSGLVIRRDTTVELYGTEER